MHTNNGRTRYKEYKHAKCPSAANMHNQHEARYFFQTHQSRENKKGHKNIEILKARMQIANTGFDNPGKGYILNDHEKAVKLLDVYLKILKEILHLKIPRSSGPLWKRQ